MFTKFIFLTTLDDEHNMSYAEKTRLSSRINPAAPALAMTRQKSNLNLMPFGNNQSQHKHQQHQQNKVGKNFFNLFSCLLSIFGFLIFKCVITFTPIKISAKKQNTVLTQIFVCFKFYRYKLFYLQKMNKNTTERNDLCQGTKLK